MLQPVGGRLLQRLPSRSHLCLHSTEESLGSGTVRMCEGLHLAAASKFTIHQLHVYIDIIWQGVPRDHVVYHLRCGCLMHLRLSECLAHSSVAGQYGVTGASWHLRSLAAWRQLTTGGAIDGCTQADHIPGGFA